MFETLTKKQLMIAGVGLIMIFTLLKGAHPPGIWGYVHFMLDYSHGFIRRGFLGEFVVAALGPDARNYNTYAYISLLLLLADFLLLFWLAARAMADTGRRRFFIVALFFANPALLYFILFAGYGEYWGLLVTLLALLFAGFWSRLAFLCCFMPFAMLIHEANYLVFFPLQFLSLLLLLQPGDKRQASGFLLWSAFLMVLFFWVGNQGLSKSEASALYHQVQSQVGVSIGRDYVMFLSDTMHGSMMHMWQTVQQYPIVIALFIAAFILFLPSVYLCLMAVFATIDSTTGRQLALSGKYMKWLAAMAPFSPLLINLVAWDFIRWLALMVISSFTLWLVVATTLQQPEEECHRQPPLQGFRFYAMAATLLFYLLLTPPIIGPGDDSFSNFPFTDHEGMVEYLLDNWDDVEYGFWSGNS